MQSEGHAPAVSGLYGIISKGRLCLRASNPRIHNLTHMRTRTHQHAQISSKLWILFLMLLISMSPNSCRGAFLPRSRPELKRAVSACLKLLPKGDCSNGRHGPIGEWDVSRVTDMSYMFST